MDNRDYQRRTCEALFFPPLRQFWVDTIAGDVVWDLAYLHNALRKEHRTEFMKIVPWSRHLQSITGQVPGSAVYLCAPTFEALSRHRVANTTAIIAYLWLKASDGDKDRSWKSLAWRTAVYETYLMNAARLVVGAIRNPNDRLITSQPGTVRIQTDGNVIGFVPMLRCNKHGFKVFEEHWNALEAEGRIRNSSNADRHGLVDIISFGVTCVQYRRRCGRTPLGASAIATLSRLRNTIVQWIGRMLQMHVPAIYHAHHPAVNQPPPPLKICRPCARQYTIVDPLAVWELAEKARATHSSFQQAIALRSDSQGLANCSPSQGEPWLNRLLQISRDGFLAAFQPHLWNHLNLVADPGSHSYKDCLVSVVLFVGMQLWLLRMPLSSNWRLAENLKG